MIYNKCYVCLARGLLEDQTISIIISWSSAVERGECWRSSVFMSCFPSQSTRLYIQYLLWHHLYWNIYNWKLKYIWNVSTLCFECTVGKIDRRSDLSLIVTSLILIESFHGILLLILSKWYILFHVTRQTTVVLSNKSMVFLIFIFVYFQGCN